MGRGKKYEPEQVVNLLRQIASVQCNRSRRAAMQDSSAFQILAFDTIHESTTHHHQPNRDSSYEWSRKRGQVTPQSSDTTGISAKKLVAYSLSLTW
ncbi:MAG: hypothetical protein NVS9B15_12380 [Acidobacteriaceae bacterium]